MIQSIRQFPNCQSIYREKTKENGTFWFDSHLIECYCVGVGEYQSDIYAFRSSNKNNFPKFINGGENSSERQSMMKIFIVSFFFYFDDRHRWSGRWQRSHASLTFEHFVNVKLHWSIVLLSSMIISIFNWIDEQPFGKKQIKSRHSFSHDDAIHRYSTIDNDCVHQSKKPSNRWHHSFNKTIFVYLFSLTSLLLMTMMMIVWEFQVGRYFRSFSLSLFE